jgi:type II secretion system protein N
VKERLLKYAPLVGYPLFYLVCLFVFAAFTFPYAKLKERVVASFNAQQHAAGGQQELQIDEMTGYHLTGVRVKGVRLLSPPPEPGKPPSKIEIDEATVRYQILPALVGNTDLTFDVYAFGGEATGEYALRGKDRDVDVDIDSVDLGQVEPLVRLLGVPLRGRVGGAVHLQMPEGKASKGSGSISLEVKDASVGDGKAKIKGALALPKVDVGALSFAAEAKDGVLRITKLVAGGKDVELQGEGRINMREMATDSLVEAQVRFKINDAYRNKDDITRSLFGAPGSSVPALFELADPRIKQSKRPDGFYAWTLRGPLGHLEFLPAGGGSFSTMPGGAGTMPMAPVFNAPRVNP